MRKLLSSNKGQTDIILAAIVMGIVFAIGIVIVFNVIGGLDLTTIDDNLADSMGENSSLYSPAANATESLTDNISVFYTIGPIALIVVAAVGILSYVLLLRRS